MRETIAAIATGMGSGIGIIRISGEEAFSVIDKIFVPKKSKKKMSEVKSHTCLLYTSPSPRDLSTYRMPSSA